MLVLQKEQEELQEKRREFYRKRIHENHNINKGILVSKKSPPKINRIIPDEEILDHSQDDKENIAINDSQSLKEIYHKEDVEMEDESSLPISHNKESHQDDSNEISVDAPKSYRHTQKALIPSLNKINEVSQEYVESLGESSYISSNRPDQIDANCLNEYLRQSISQNQVDKHKNSKSSKNLEGMVQQVQTQQVKPESPIVDNSVDLFNKEKKVSVTQPNYDIESNWTKNPLDSLPYHRQKSIK